VTDNEKQYMKDKEDSRRKLEDLLEQEDEIDFTSVVILFVIVIAAILSVMIQA